MMNLMWFLIVWFEHTSYKSQTPCFIQIATINLHTYLPNNINFLKDIARGEK